MKIIFGFTGAFFGLIVGGFIGFWIGFASIPVPSDVGDGFGALVCCVLGGIIGCLLGVWLGIFLGGKASRFYIQRKRTPFGTQKSASEHVWPPPPDITPKN